eukprot:g14254.t1
MGPGVNPQVVNGGVLYVDEGAATTFMGTSDFSDNSVANEQLGPISCGDGCTRTAQGESYIVKKGAAVHNKVWRRDRLLHLLGAPTPPRGRPSARVERIPFTDPVEHRFGHMRQGGGSHRNPTAAQAKERAARGDLNRGLHGGSRANYNRNARKGRDFVASGYRAEIMLPVGEEERSVRFRARTKDSAEAVLAPRYISVSKPGAAP